MKDKQEIIEKFNVQVNMSAEELEKWLDSPESHKAGTGVGIESGRKIIDILRRNPNMDSDQYEDRDIEHMRRVVSYNSRHLAQEDHLKDTKRPEELEKTKSTISLRNWGHDPLKELKGTKRKENSNTSVPDQIAGDGSKTKKTKFVDGNNNAEIDNNAEGVTKARDSSSTVEEAKLSQEGSSPTKPVRRNPSRQAKRSSLPKA